MGLGCSEEKTDTPPNDVPETTSDVPETTSDVPATPSDVVSMTEGQSVYMNSVEGGNVFACNTCHALQEPSADGIRRVGHALGDATRRPSWKNGNAATMLEAVNSCLTEWMSVSEPWEETEPRWLALYE